jgi:hypothetical protein
VDDKGPSNRKSPTHLKPQKIASSPNFGVDPTRPPETIT